jgi:hypothetical protein
MRLKYWRGRDGTERVYVRGHGLPGVVWFDRRGMVMGIDQAALDASAAVRLRAWDLAREVHAMQARAGGWGALVDQCRPRRRRAWQWWARLAGIVLGRALGRAGL